MVEQMWLWDKHLAHLAFPLLKKLFHSLFKNRNVNFFHCDVLGLAKHHGVSFPLRGLKIISPFSLIHMDFWDPSCITNILGTRWFATFIDECTHTTWVYLMKSK